MQQRIGKPVISIFLLCLSLYGESAGAAPPLPAGHPRLQITEHQPSPVIVHVGAVDRDIVALQIEAQRTERTAVEPYKPRPGDVTKVNEQHGVVNSVELIRDGKRVGYLAGRDRSHVWFFEKLVGNTLDIGKADNPASYQISLSGSSQSCSPSHVWRKSKPIDIALPATEFPTRHYIYLPLSTSLESGRTYTLHLPDLNLNEDAVTFLFDSKLTRSEAIHVNHIGYRPDDPVKHAFLSVWLGNGGPHSFGNNLPFQLVNHETNEVVHRGSVSDVWPADRPEQMKRKQNHSLTDVVRIDFSEFVQSGTYRVSVEGIGCSYPFTIIPMIWEEPFLIAMKGFYHQRSGLALRAPYTDFTRPRPYHPNDGLKVYASAVTLMETRNGLNLLGESSNFGALNENVTAITVDNAWGGYFDAADWDRRIQHLSSSRSHLELLELFPSYFTDLSLNIPESGDAIPDLLDEALFNIDCYRRLQTPEGGIRGGIEAAEHPVKGETSWLESLRVMTYAPGPWSSYMYVNVAARAAYLLKPYDEERASILQQSALRAWQWAEVNCEQFQGKYGKHPRWNEVVDERNLAALELYRLTAEKKWHDRFVEDSIFAMANPADQSQSGRQRDAAFLYARLPEKSARSHDRVEREACTAS